MQLEPNDLLLFARVVEEGSFSRAAQRLGVPISTVSRRITALETQLKERLLLRTTRKLTVTELGLGLLEHARQVVEGVDAATSLADHRQVQPSGRLRISVPPDLPFLAPVLAEFLSKYPSIDLESTFPCASSISLPRTSTWRCATGSYAMSDARGAARHRDPGGSLRLTGVSQGARDTEGTRGTAPAQGPPRLSRTGEPLPWVLVRGKARWQGVPPGRAVVNSPELRIHMAVHGAGITLAEESAAEPMWRPAG